MDPAKLQEHAISYYMELFAVKPACPEVIQHLHEVLPKLSTSEVHELKQELSLVDPIAVVGDHTTKKALGLNRGLQDFLVPPWSEPPACLPGGP